MGFFSSLFGGGHGGEAKAKEAVNAWKGIDLPTSEQLKIKLEELVSQGVIKPEEVATYMQDPSLMAGVSTDPRLKEAQMRALSSLEEVGAEGGMTAADKARLMDINDQQKAVEKGQRQAILQNAAERGVGGSGLEMAASLANEQESANRAARQGTDVAAMAQERALNAMIQSGQLGGQMQGAEFQQKAAQAQAQDTINAFNTANQQRVASQNVADRNNAQALNLAEKQRIADLNTGTRNDMYNTNNSANAQKLFENSMAKTTGLSNTLMGQSSLEAKNAANTGIMGGLVKDAIGGAGAAAGKAIFGSDERLKKDVSDFDAGAFLEDLTGHRYRYRNPEDGKGPQIGVMAQDVEKVAPQAVVEREDGMKGIDYQKLAGPILASLADVHHRLKKVEEK